MKRIIRFSKAYLPTAIVSTVLIIAGIVGYIINGGFNLGVDFQAGLLQEIQFAPTAFSVTYSGKGVASVSMSEKQLDIVVSGSDVEKATHSFPFVQYAALGSMVDAINAIEGLAATAPKDASAESSWLILSAQQNPRLGSIPYALHFLKPGSPVIDIETVRAATISIGTVSVQELGKKAERKFLIRVQDEGKMEAFAKDANEKISAALAAAFGEGEVAVSRSDYVGAQYSANLTDQVGLLLVLTLLLILGYSAIRFKAGYAIGAVLAIIHDALIMVAFIAWSRMEFNTTTIAAIMTILGYSINDTIVIFDRVRETVRLYPDQDFMVSVDQANTETLSRTFITTLTTMFAVLSLFLFTSGSMKDFALALLVGMISGVYSTVYIATSFVVWWEKMKIKRAAKAKNKVKPIVAPVKA